MHLLLSRLLLPWAFLIYMGKTIDVSYVPLLSPMQSAL